MRTSHLSAKHTNRKCQRQAVFLTIKLAEYRGEFRCTNDGGQTAVSKKCTWQLPEYGAKFGEELETEEKTDEIGELK